MSTENGNEMNIPIGITDWRGEHKQFGIKAKDRLHHMYVIGKTGVGNSTLLQNMAIFDIKQGTGLAVIIHMEILLDYIPVISLMTLLV